VADFPKTAKEAFIFFQAEGNRLFGSGGVNNLMSGFTEGDGGSLEILPAAATLMMGPNMELETEFFRRLASVSAYAVHGDELTLSDAGGSAALRFTALSPARVAGTYRGVLPCANCEGIETEVVLTAGGSYTRTLRYRGKPGETIQDEGTFSLNHLDNALVLDNVDKAKEPAFYGIAPGSLIQLDLEGKPITGNLAGLYELKRQ
jgi:hypothetical protein